MNVRLRIACQTRASAALAHFSAANALVEMIDEAGGELLKAKGTSSYSYQK